MSGEGQSFNPMELMFPLQSAQQRQLSRSQAYAQMLLGSQPQSGAYGGLASAGRELAGALLQRNVNEKETGIAQQYASAFQNMSGGDNSQTQSQPSSPQISNAQPNTQQPSTPNTQQQPLAFNDFYNNYLGKQEGGYVANDGNGTPSNYGINQKANPGVNVKNLSQPQAAQILQQQYWDKSGAANLPPALAAIHADTAVNMGLPAATQLLQASGGDPNAYMQLRAQRYQQIAKANPHMVQYLPAWNNRLQALGQYASTLQGRQPQPDQTSPTPSTSPNIGQISSQPQSAPPSQGPFGLPGLPGYTTRQNMMMFALNSPEYTKNVIAQAVPTDVEKNFASAYGKDTPQYRNAMQAYAIKEGSTAGRPGGFIFNEALPGGGVGIPNGSGMTPTMQPNGQMGMVNAPGSLPALGGVNYAQTAGSGAATPAVAFVNGQPVATNKYAMAGNQGNPLGLPGQPPQTTAPPQAGLVAKPGASPQSGPTPAAQPPSGPGNGSMLPELPPGYTSFQNALAGEAAQRHGDTVAVAQEAPMRLNVLSNILHLSQSGISTGPGQDWQNDLLGHVANMPGAGMLLSGTQQQIGNYQELKKFTYQQGIRAWQAVGGTQTNEQLNKLSEANPNTEMYPNAIQAITKWTMAGEQAVMAKANAQDQFLAQNGMTPQAQLSFENKWRNSFDQNAFRLGTMSQPEAVEFLKTLSPAERNSIVQHRQQMIQLGVNPATITWTQ